MSENADTVELKRITIKTESGSKWFDSVEKLLGWIVQQRQLYHFAGNLTQKYGIQNFFGTMDQSWNHLQKLAQHQIRSAENDPEKYAVQIENFSKVLSEYLDHRKIFTSSAPFAKFIERQANQKAEFGLAAISVIFDLNIQSVDRYIYQGLKDADDYLGGNEGRIADEAATLQGLKEKWDEELTNQRDIWLNEYQQKTDEATRQNLKVDGLISDWQDQTQTQTEDLESHKTKFQSEYEEELSKARTDLNNLKRTFEDDLALQAPVAYWKTQLSSHNKKAFIYGVTLGVLTLIVLSTIILFAVYGLDKPLKEVAVSKLFTAAAITTFGIWIIKIVANIFMSHLHLATDAQERRTMIHTYLALTRKGQGPKEEDRQLILQTLFRPSTTDMVKNDQGPSQLVDMINRLSPKP